MKESTLSYIAGFFDADGSISLVRFKSKETKQLNVNFTNTDLSILKFIQGSLEELGLTGWIVKSSKREDHYLQGYQLVYYRNTAILVMEAILPYIKHQKKVKRFELFKSQYRPLIKPNGKYSDSERMELEKIAQQIVEIKV